MTHVNKSIQTHDQDEINEDDVDFAKAKKPPNFWFK